MILNDNQIRQFLNDKGLYDCRLVQQRFAFKLFGEDVSPHGDILSFISPTVIGPLVIEKSLVLAVELPGVNMFGGACFQRLFLNQLGSFISVTTNKQCFVDENSIFVDGKQVSLSILNPIKDSIVFHIIFAIELSIDKINCLSFDKKQLEEFQQNAVDSFHYLTKSIFIETRRDNL
jgi:hypothetical protein